MTFIYRRYFQENTQVNGHHVSDNNDVDVDEEGEKRAVASVVGRGGRRDGTQLLL